MTTEPGQNLSVVLVQLEHVKDKNENVYTEILQKMTTISRQDVTQSQCVADPMHNL